ncbi:MAG: hypothetical protein ACE5IB_06740 [Candidatus Geothermarchaeales archaeon]
MLYITSGNLKEGRGKEYQAWVKENEELMKKHAPQGWTYRGTYFYVLGFGRYSVAVMWECGKYGDFDTSREHDDETWIRLNEEASDFFTPDPGEAVLLREIGDTRIIEPKKREE